MIRSQLLTLLLLAVLGSPQALANDRSDYSYTARPGDNLWDLARRFCGSHHHALELSRYNRLADPASLRAGERVRIPVSCLVKQPAAASVRVGSESAELVRDGVAQAVPAGTEVRMGDSIRTGDGGFVVVQFADSSLLTVRPDSTVMFVLISAFGETGMVDTLVRVNRGRVQHVVNDSMRGSRHRIATPVGVAAVRGTRFRVGVPGGTDGNSATVATTEGVVGFEDARAQALDLPAGTGVVATESGSVKELLLPAPALPARVDLVQAQTLDWPDVPDAVGYRVTGFSSGEPVFEALSTDSEIVVPASQGVYDLTVRGIAASGLEGLDAAAQLVVAAPVPTNLGHDVQDDGSVHLSWSGEVGESGFVVQIRDSQRGDWREVAATGDRRATVPLPTGTYAWRVGSGAPHWSEASELIVPAVSVTDLVTSRGNRDAPLQVAWTHAALDASSYLVEVARDESFSRIVGNRTVDQSAVASVEVSGCHPCYVRVLAETSGVQSGYTVAEFRDEPRHPWPIYVLLLAVLLSL